MTIENLLNPKLDYVFKRIFGYVGNEEITIGLLNAIIKEKVENIELDSNPILERDLLDDKLGILDIKAKINDNINCNIELQIVDNKDIEKRILFYWSKMYAQTIKKGKKYNELEKCIVILFTDYKLENLQKIKKYITKWNIREEESHQTILTEMLEIYILELEKYKESKDKNELDVWINFLKNPEGVNMENNNTAVVKAKKVLEEISQDKRERYLAELREKYILDQRAIEDTGIEKGRKIGREEGKIEEKKSTAIRMKKEKLNIDVISKVTGLTKEEIEKL